MHKKSKGQSFLQGAFIMMAASLVVKVIGAFFQIPLQNLIGGEKSPAFGMFSAAYRIYTAMLVVSTVGLPAALSKMVAEATARGREHEVRRIVRVAAGIFVPVGALCSLALFFGAGTFAAWIKSEDSRLAVMAIAPSVLMVAILSVFRGYYQGRSNMVPTAVSQVIEAAGKLFIGLGLACWAVGRGFDDPVVAAAYMLVQAVLSRGETRVRALDPAVRPTLTLAKTLLSLSIPITISSSVMSITDLIDVALISSRLQSPAVHMAADEAMQTYGIYTGVINFFNLPQTLITALAVSVLPTIASARAAGNETGANRTLSTTLRMTLMLTLPAGAGFFLLGGPILRIFLSSGTVLGGQLMSILGFAVPAVALVAVTNAVLQAYSRIDLPLVSMCLGAAVKLCGDYFMIGDPRFSIAGAPISTALCYWLIALLNLFHIARLSHGLPPIGRTLVRPLAATAGMGAVVVIGKTLVRLAGPAPGSALDKLATLAIIAAAALVYGVLLLALRAIERADVLLLPHGTKIADILHLK